MSAAAVVARCDAVSRGYSAGMRRLAFLVLIATVLSSCGNIVIGPVDHSCPTKPWKGNDGSGCSVGRG